MNEPAARGHAAVDRFNTTFHEAVVSELHTALAAQPGSRVISAQKANTANSFSLPGLALSTANLFAAVQPNGSLYGLQESNPVDVDVAYSGVTADYGQPTDPMVGHRIGGGTFHAILC